MINLGRAFLLAAAAALAFVAVPWLGGAGDGPAVPLADGLLPTAVETALRPPVAIPDSPPDTGSDPDADAALARAIARFEEPPAAPFASLAATAEAGDDHPAEPHGYGDDRALDVLWHGCEAGEGAACDRLFEDSPVGSAYEHFGLTCGDRPLVLDCTAELTN